MVDIKIYYPGNQSQISTFYDVKPGFPIPREGEIIAVNEVSTNALRVTKVIYNMKNKNDIQVSLLVEDMKY